MLRESLAIQRRAFAGDDRRVLASMTNLGVTLVARGQRTEAEALVRDVLSARRRAEGSRIPAPRASVKDTLIQPRWMRHRTGAVCCAALCALLSLPEPASTAGQAAAREKVLATLQLIRR
jgi:hypothetical protein